AARRLAENAWLHTHEVRSAKTGPGSTGPKAGGAMKDWGLFAAAMAGVVAGCAAQQLTTAWSATPASAQQDVNVPRWQYPCFEADSAADAQEQLSQAGVERWELAAATTTYGSTGIFCMKRPRRE